MHEYLVSELSSHQADEAGSELVYLHSMYILFLALQFAFFEAWCYYNLLCFAHSVITHTHVLFVHRITNIKQKTRN